MKNMAQLMKQAQQMQQRMAEMQERVAQIEVAGSAGAGMIQILINGKNVIKSLKIDPSLLNPEEVDVLEDLIIAAFNDAKGKLDEQMNDEMSKATGGLNIPGLKLPF